MKGFNKDALANEDRRKATIQFKKNLSKPTDARASMKNKPTSGKNNPLGASQILSQWDKE